jgi:two-component system cell cycle sensor histidine kinase/response regulator CckA
LKSLVGMAFDIQARKELAAQELRAEKLDSLGRLAGGIAHDFNNILTVVLGNVALARSALAQGADPAPQLDEIHRVADQAAAISRQLLGFARRQATRVEVIDPNQCIEELAPMLRRLLDPRRLTLELGLAPTVRIDRAQLAQAFLNLVTNAREADGSLSIMTEQVELDRGLGPRPYARIVFADDGRGMAPDTVQRAFDPFFTTKGRGGGAGLGLATVYGIVHQHEGTIDVTSEPGRGTRVTLTFPGIDGQPGFARPSIDGQPGLARPSIDGQPGDPVAPRPGAARPRVGSKPAGRSALILVAEDEPMVAELTRRILTHAGHRVVVAPDGRAALELFEQSPEPIEIVVSDIVMPHMSGLELARRLATLRPELPILLASGYPEDDRRLGDDLLSRTPFLAKPFKSSDLVAAVANLLSAAAERAVERTAS